MPGFAVTSSIQSWLQRSTSHEDSRRSRWQPGSWSPRSGSSSDGFASHASHRISALPSVPPSTQSALSLAREGNRFAQRMSDTQLLRQGVPLAHLTVDVPLVTIGEHRRVLVADGYSALALSFCAAEQQRHHDLMQMAHTYFGSLCDWMVAFRGGEDITFDEQNRIESPRRRAVSAGGKLKMWCDEIIDLVGELRAYEQWLGPDATGPVAHAGSPAFGDTIEEVHRLLSVHRWQPSALEPHALYRLDELLAPLPEQPMATPAVAGPGVLVGLGITFGPEDLTRPPSYPTA